MPKGDNKRTHGLSKHPLHKRWQAMKSRCSNPNIKQYEDYGGRGITVCERWRGPMGFAHFLADMGECPDGFTLDRIDVDGGYEPSNCRWASRHEQQMNRRVVRVCDHRAALDEITRLRLRVAELEACLEGSP